MLLATTLGAFDVIDGGAGSDTLNIYTAGTLDASKFVGATQVWQDTNAADVSQLADGVTAGLA